MSSAKKGEAFSYEFGGPIGALATTLALPLVVVLLSYWTHHGALVVPSSWKDLLLIHDDDNNNSDDIFSMYIQCTFGLLAWFGGLAILWAVLPGPVVKGVHISNPYAQKKKDNDTTTFQLEYKLNGHLTFWVIVGLVLIFQVPLNDYLYRYYTPLAVMDIILCTIMSLILYLASFRSPDIICAKGGNSGNPIYDFFMGRELNPRFFGNSFDWKVFCELRPGLIGWMLINYACLQEQYAQLGYVTGSMYLINIFQAIYVWDALYQERAILTTMDVTTDGFGFMLVFGDLTWVPFTYTVPAKYLVQHDPQLSNMSLMAIVALYILGYSIFRASNGQKDIFRRNPNNPKVSHLQYLQTKRGTRLLTSGWWGMARKINYTGDYLMGLTYSLVCGVNSIVPYYYAIYFAILLIHRSIRDDEMCHEKYGNDWLEYKRQVPYRFIPGVV